MTEFFLYLPQMRMEVETIVERAQAAEQAGFTGIAFMDHLAPPLGESLLMHEAMTVATWAAAHTTTLKVSHLVLCDALRHPAVLARQAVTLDRASGGRFELGIGYGSVVDELITFGVTTDGPANRAERLAESLDVIGALWSGEPVDYRGRYFELSAPAIQPVPVPRIPILVGGVGRRTLEIVQRHADWWNVPIYALGRIAELRPLAGPARVSSQHLIGWVDDPSRRAEVEATAIRRFGRMTGGPTIGDATQIRELFEAYEAQGVERFYVWFTDFAQPASLASFGEQVIAASR